VAGQHAHHRRPAGQVAGGRELFEAGDAGGRRHLAEQPFRGHPAVGLEDLPVSYRAEGAAGLVGRGEGLLPRGGVPDANGCGDRLRRVDDAALHDRRRAGGLEAPQHREFVGGVITQFFYVAAQVGVGAFFINYVTEHWAQMGNQQAAYLLSIAMLAFMFGRFFSTWLMGRVSAQKLLLIYALINIALCGLVVIGLEGISVIALIAVFFFMSIMFPTLFAMGVKNLGPHTKRGSSFMIMAIVGGALMPYLMGKVADNSTVALAYLLPMGCFVIVAVYARSRLRHP
jgi:fucose permease